MVQRVSVGQTNVQFDTMEINILNADYGKFKLRYRIPDTLDVQNSEDIIAGGDAEQFRDAIKKYYEDRFDVKPEVTRTFHDSDGEETTENAQDVHSVRYTVVTPIAITTYSVEQITVI